MYYNFTIKITYADKNFFILNFYFLAKEKLTEKSYRINFIINHLSKQTLARKTKILKKRPFKNEIILCIITIFVHRQHHF